jgi:hypothetical protein
LAAYLSLGAGRVVSGRIRDFGQNVLHVQSAFQRGISSSHPDVAVLFFSSYCNDKFFTALNINVISTIRTSIA